MIHVSISILCLLIGGCYHRYLWIAQDWKDPKSDNIMYKKDLLWDWMFAHFFDCVWYLDYPKDTTPLIESGIKEKNNPSFGRTPYIFKELGYDHE